MEKGGDILRNDILFFSLFLFVSFSISVMSDSVLSLLKIQGGGGVPKRPPLNTPLL